MEHRWGRRISADVVVRLIGSPGAIGMGQLCNVSATGAFVQTKLELPLLSPVRVERISGLPPTDYPCAGRGYVVRQVSTGVGIEWFAVALDPERIPHTALAGHEFLEDSAPMAREMDFP